MEQPAPSDPPNEPSEATEFCLIRPPRSCDPCPRCGNGKMDYNGLLELECIVCGYRYNNGACT